MAASSACRSSSDRFHDTANWRAVDAVGRFERQQSRPALRPAWAVPSRPAPPVAASRRRRLAGGKASMTTPPPSVRSADWSRRMKRSPRSAPIGRSRLSCTSALRPGATAAPSSSTTRAPTSSAPRCRCTGVQCTSGRLSPASSCTRASRRCVGACSASATSQSPRRTSALSTPARFECQALPGAAFAGRAGSAHGCRARARPAAWRQHQALAHRHPAGDGGAGDHGADARQREAAVHRQAEVALAGAGAPAWRVPGPGARAARRCPRR